MQADASLEKSHLSGGMCLKQGVTYALEGREVLSENPLESRSVMMIAFVCPVFRV